QPRMNRPPTDPQGFGHKTDSPIPKGAGFCRGPAPPRPLVEQRGQSSIFVSNEFHLFFPRHAASLPAASCLFKLFFLRALASSRSSARSRLAASRYPARADHSARTTGGNPW